MGRNDLPYQKKKKKNYLSKKRKKRKRKRNGLPYLILELQLGCMCADKFLELGMQFSLCSQHICE
jgi:hypothetical protein